MIWSTRRVFQAQIDGLQRELQALRERMVEIGLKASEKPEPVDHDVLMRLVESNERLTSSWQDWYARERERLREQRKAAGQRSAEVRKERKQEELPLGDPSCRVCRGETHTPLELLAHLNNSHGQAANGTTKN